MIIRIGVPENSIDNKGVSNESKGLWLEYGTPRTPVRPWLSMARDAIYQYDFFQALLDPQGAGEDMAKIMQAQFDGEFIPLATSTIKARQRKGNYSQQPTIDTGQLRDSIAYEVIDD